MPKIFRQICIIFLFIIISDFSYANIEEIKKINQQLESIETLYNNQAIDKIEYEKIKTRLIIKKNKLQNKKKTSTKNSEDSVTLQKQIEVLEKLLSDGVISQDEFDKSLEFLKNKEAAGENINLEDYKKEEAEILEYTFNYKKDPGKRNWEKAELIYKNFKIVPNRPGGIQVRRVSDNKKLFQISDNFKMNYLNGGERHITIKKTVYDVGSGNVLDVSSDIKDAAEDIKKSLSDLARVLKNPFKKKEKPKWDKDAHKLELFIDNAKLLTFEGRYVKKHRAFFYQVLTPKNEAFHYYIKIRGRKAIALNMEFFNVKIDRAIRKAKKRLSDEYDVTEEEIEKIIDKRLTEEIDRSVDDMVEKEMERAINESVAQAIEESIGQAMSEGIMDAIEKATGEAISQAMEDELANHIDQEIERAIQDGIEEAAVAAGFQAYYDTLLAGGSIEEALRNAGEACGAGCEFVLDE